MRRFISTILLAFLGLASTQWAQAQTYKVIYNFTGQNDGGHPVGNMAIDRGGNLYGTGYAFGQYGFGTVYKLTKKNSSWLFAVLYAFQGGIDGAYAGNGVTIGPNGTLYGVTTFGGFGCGTVFNLKPPPTHPATPFSPWNESVLYRFNDDNYNCRTASTVTFDKSGDMYGVTDYHGPAGGGTVYELTPSGSGWQETTLYASKSGEGGQPNGAVVLDSGGNLYGANAFGGPSDAGTIFQLTPSGSGWTMNVLTGFPLRNDGDRPYGGVILDPSGNVYGTTSFYGSDGGGTVFVLTPGAWTFSLLYSFAGNGGPVASLTMDPAGNLYGTTGNDGAYQQGNVFKLTPSNGGWIYTDLHDFTGGADGAYPTGSVLLDANGTLYGTTLYGGTGPCSINQYTGCGVIWKITP